MMYLTPVWVLDIISRIHPRVVIGLLCHWVNEKNPDIEERQLATRKPNILPVAKKFCALSTLSILNLLRQDSSLWRFYFSNDHGGAVGSLATLPYILMEVVYDLGGDEGRQKVIDVVRRSRMTIGSFTQGNILENFKVDTVIDIFEILEKTGGAMEIKMRLSFSNEHAVAMWLDHWDLKMRRIDQPTKSSYWLGQLPGARAFAIQRHMRELEFRRKYEREWHLYEYNNEWKESLGVPHIKRKKRPVHDDNFDDDERTEYL
jgi:hypothetical protein